MVNIKSFPLVEDNVAPERVSVFIPTLSVAVTVKVTVLDCADVSKLTMFELLLLVKLLITGLWSSSVVIVIFLVLLVELPAASVTITLIVSVLVEPTL